MKMYFALVLAAAFVVVSAKITGNPVEYFGEKAMKFKYIMGKDSNAVITDSDCKKTCVHNFVLPEQEAGVLGVNSAKAHYRGYTCMCYVKTDAVKS